MSKYMCFSTPDERRIGYKLCALMNHNAKTIEFFQYWSSNKYASPLVDGVNGYEGSCMCNEYTDCKTLLSHLQKDNYSVLKYHGSIPKTDLKNIEQL